jgi:uncharacterized protein YigA (DUF484 family)
MTAGEINMADAVAADLTDEEVRDYLKDNSDFFERHPDMLDYLHISHRSGSAVSLVEKQVSVLRERNMEMRKRLNSLTENARHNDKLYEATRKLVLKLLEATDRDTLGAAFSSSMREDFDVEHASLILFGDPLDSTTQCRVESADSARIEIGALIKARKAICGALRRQELTYLFPQAGDVGSAAVMPLHNQEDLGVIAVGSDDAGYYAPGMGTLFLHHIADVIVRLLPRLDSAP